MRTSSIIPVGDESGVGEARRRASDLGRQAGLNDVDTGRLGIVVTELGRNLVKHGRGGDFVFNLLDSGQTSGIEVLALDKGPGMRDLAACLRDGYSTAGTPGNGLGAVRRQADVFEVASWPDQGTALLARVLRDRRAADAGAPRLGAVCLAKPGEIASGDALDVSEAGGSLFLFAADGLGHGPEAAKASTEAVRLFHKRSTQSPADIIAAIHAGMRHTRGAAVAVAEVDRTRRSVNFCGLGNISGVVIGPHKVQRMLSQNGTAGHAGRSTRVFTYELPANSLVILHSDGLTSSWSLERYPGLLRSDPALIAAILYRDFGRGRDDASVLVYAGGSA